MIFAFIFLLFAALEDDQNITSTDEITGTPVDSSSTPIPDPDISGSIVTDDISEDTSVKTDEPVTSTAPTSDVVTEDPIEPNITHTETEPIETTTTTSSTLTPTATITENTTTTEAPSSDTDELTTSFSDVETTHPDDIIPTFDKANNFSLVVGLTVAGVCIVAGVIIFFILYRRYRKKFELSESMITPIVRTELID